MVSKDLEGDLSIEQTDHMVAKGAKGLGAVGFVVGLAAPPLLAATAIGAATGPAQASSLRRWPAERGRGGRRRTIPLGGAGLIVAYQRDQAEEVGPQ